MERRGFLRKAGLVGLATGPLAAAPLGALPPIDTAPANAVDVRDFGAKGDGAADDSAALQRAVEAGAGALRLPRGTYRITRPIEVDLARNGVTSLLGGGEARVVMEAAGPAFHFVGTHGGTGDPSSVRDGVWENERLPLLGGLEIRGAHEESVGVRLERTMQSVLASLLVRRCRVGLHFVKRNRNVIVSHCHVYHNREIGVFFDAVDLHQAIIASSHISYNRRAGILLEGGGMRNFQIVGNDIEYNHDEKLEGSADILIDMRPEGSTFREGTIVGNTIQARPSPDGANVRVLGSDGLRTSGLLAITGNLIGSQTDNIVLARCRGVAIAGNSLYSAADRTLAFRGCANVTVSGNTIDWNPDHRGKQLVDGITIEDCDGVTLSGLLLENCFRGEEEAGGAIEVRDSRDVTITGCQVLDPRHRGIVLDGVVRCRVSDTTIVDRRPEPTMRQAIEVLGTSRDNLVSGCMLHEGRGLRSPAGAVTQAGNIEVDPRTT